MSSFKERIANIRRNPSLMQFLIYDELDKKLNATEEEYDIPDATLPFAFAMECGVVETAMAIDEMESISRTLFPKLAIEHSDLYKHMSDDDYIGRFATPARTTFELLLAHDDVIAKAIPYDDSGNRRLIIPRFTEFRAADLNFTMQYPININVFPHGGINIVYDGTVKSPIETLTTNILDWDMLLLNRRKIIRIKIPVYQMTLNTETDALSPSTLFSTDYVFTDKFFHARAYIDSGEGWKEVYSTHSDLVYDPARITVVFKVVGNKLKVSIPAIYTNLNMVKGNIRIDIYTTKGAISRELGNYKTDQFSFKLNDIDDDKTYVSPLNTLSIIQPLSRVDVKGGYDNISLDKLRDRVIHNTLGPSNLPITNVQIEDALDRRGYNLISNVDNITNRQFLATRSLGKPEKLNLVSGAGLNMSEWILDMESLAESEHVYDNNETLTVKPSMLFRFNNGIVTPLIDSEIARINNLNPDTKARESNLNRFLYSPFHVVMDTRGDTFDVRPYYLDKPVITEKTFIGDNPTSNLQATINNYEINKTDEGYKFLIELDTSDALSKMDPENVVVQLGYKPLGENRWASVNGTFIEKVDKKFYYEIDVLVNHDINAQGLMLTNNMSMFSLSQTNFRTTLKADFDLTVILTEFRSADYKANELDDLIQAHLLPTRFMCITRERLVTTLGYDLTKLWRRSRTLLGPESYVTYTEDIYDFYEENVYERDVDGNLKLGLDSSGNVTYNLLHAKGDPKLDSNGNPIIKYFKGYPVIEDGKQVLKEPRKLKREVSMLMVDGIFYLATEQTAMRYREEIPMTIVNWLETDIDHLNAVLLEMAELYLYPTNTFGDCKVRFQEEQVVTVPIEQALTVKYYLSEKDFNNVTLRPMLIDVAKEVINDAFNRTTVAISDIVSRIRNSAGEHILAVDVLGLGGNDYNFDVVTLEDNAVRLTIKKKLVVLSNQEITVEDDVNVVFFVHK